MEAADVEELCKHTGFRYDVLGPIVPSRTLWGELCGQNQGLVLPSVHGSGILLPSPISKGTGWGKAPNKSVQFPKHFTGPLSAKPGKQSWRSWPRAVCGLPLALVVSVQPVEALTEAVRRWEDGGSRILWWQKLCLWLSLVLPKSDCYGNLIALIFLAWCAVFPGFPFAEQIP